MIADYLSTSPEPNHRSTQYLHSYAIRQLLEKNVIIEKVAIPYLEKLLPHHFKQVDGRWYLRGEQVLEGGLGIDIRNEASALDWLTRILFNKPQTIGELTPQWQIATLSTGNAINKTLEQILEENFWQDKRTGRWRLPTPAEREQMSARADLSSQAHLRVIHRYLAGDLERRPNDLELAAWVRFCYSREFFSEAAQLFPRINESHLEPDEYRAIKRMATVSKLRAGETG